MKILAIDTTSKILSIALSEDREVLIEKNYNAERAHSRRLIVKIDKVLKAKDTGVDKIDGFIAGLGPGSFTGMRIGASAVKGFGIATGKPCTGVASIDAIAMNARNVKADFIVPVLDARRRQVYAAIYTKAGSAIIRRTGYLLLSPEALSHSVNKLAGRVAFVGDGIPLYRNILETAADSVFFVREGLWYPSAGNLIRLGFDRLKRQKNPGLSRIRPIYIYPEDCQVRKQ